MFNEVLCYRLTHEDSTRGLAVIIERINIGISLFATSAGLRNGDVG